MWACSAVAFLVVSLAIGVLAGPVDLGVGSVLESAGARLHLPGVSTSLSPTEEAIPVSYTHLTLPTIYSV